MDDITRQIVEHKRLAALERPQPRSRHRTTSPPAPWQPGGR
jgi:hypothetical protein